MDPLEDVYRAERGRVLASLIRLLGSFELAEEALNDALAAAARQWPAEGVPRNPRAWLVSAGRFKAIDRLRREARHKRAVAVLGHDADTVSEPELSDEAIRDDQLRLIFVCCHPALAPEAQVALTLREVCGLTTEEIARAFLVAPSTLAQRIVRAKAKIRDAQIPYEVPEAADLGQRLAGVLRVIYLVFNEGYSASSGDALVRRELSAEAIRLGRQLLGLLPEPEVAGLLALMLLHDSRRSARADGAGDLVLLPDQNRTLWDRAEIAEGIELVEQALSGASAGPYALQAGIAAEHVRAATASATDWARIVSFYDRLLALAPTPVIALNRAVAIAERDGAAAGLTLVDELIASDLGDYALAHSARAELSRRLGRIDDSRAAYERALSLATQEPERRFLQRKIKSLDDPA